MLDKENEIFVRRTEEYYGAETPFVMRFYIRNKHIEYELPLIRYGIAGKPDNQTAYIYMVQRKKKYGDAQLQHTKEIDKIINQVNSGVKSMRNVTPSMIFVSTLFVGMLQREGINTIVIPDFLPRRYAHFHNVSTEEQRDDIQRHATNKFLEIFLRLGEQLDGFTITALPNDIDSFMHVKLGQIQNGIFTPQKLDSKNAFLRRMYLTGFQHELDSKSNYER